MIATSELGNSAPAAVPRTGSCLSGHADTKLPNQLQENYWGVDTLYLQFPFPYIFRMQGWTLLNLSHPHGPQTHADTHTCPQEGCQLRAGLPPTTLVGASPQHIPPTKLFRSISCEIPLAPSHNMSASAAAASFPRLRFDKTVNPALASQQPDLKKKGRRKRKLSCTAQGIHIA